MITKNTPSNYNLKLGNSLRKAIDFFNVNNFTKALDILKECLNMTEDKHVIIFIRKTIARCYISLGTSEDDKVGREEQIAILKKYPNAFEVIMDLAICYVQLREDNEAIKYARKIVQASEIEQHDHNEGQSSPYLEWFISFDKLKKNAGLIIISIEKIKALEDKVNQKKYDDVIKEIESFLTLFRELPHENLTFYLYKIQALAYINRESGNKKLDYNEAEKIINKISDEHCAMKIKIEIATVLLKLHKQTDFLLKTVKLSKEILLCNYNLASNMAQHFIYQYYQEHKNLDDLKHIFKDKDKNYFEFSLEVGYIEGFLYSAARIAKNIQKLDKQHTVRFLFDINRFFIKNSFNEIKKHYKHYEKVVSIFEAAGINNSTDMSIQTFLLEFWLQLIFLYKEMGRTSLVMHYAKRILNANDSLKKNFDNYMRERDSIYRKFNLGDKSQLFINLNFKKLESISKEFICNEFIVRKDFEKGIKYFNKLTNSDVLIAKIYFYNKRFKECVDITSDLINRKISSHNFLELYLFSAASIKENIHENFETSINFLKDLYTHKKQLEAGLVLAEFYRTFPENTFDPDIASEKANTLYADLANAGCHSAYTHYYQFLFINKKYPELLVFLDKINDHGATRAYLYLELYKLNDEKIIANDLSHKELNEIIVTLCKKIILAGVDKGHLILGNLYFFDNEYDLALEHYSQCFFSYPGVVFEKLIKCCFEKYQATLNENIKNTEIERDIQFYLDSYGKEAPDICKQYSVQFDQLKRTKIDLEYKVKNEKKNFYSILSDNSKSTEEMLSSLFSMVNFQQLPDKILIIAIFKITTLLTSSRQKSITLFNDNCTIIDNILQQCNKNLQTKKLSIDDYCKILLSVCKLYRFTFNDLYKEILVKTTTLLQENISQLSIENIKSVFFSATLAPHHIENFAPLLDSLMKIIKIPNKFEQGQFTNIIYHLAILDNYKYNHKDFTFSSHRKLIKEIITYSITMQMNNLTLPLSERQQLFLTSLYFCHRYPSCIDEKLNFDFEFLINELNGIPLEHDTTESHFQKSVFSFFKRLFACQSEVFTKTLPVDIYIKSKKMYLQCDGYQHFTHTNAEHYQLTPKDEFHDTIYNLKLANKEQLLNHNKPQVEDNKIIHIDLNLYNIHKTTYLVDVFEKASGEKIIFSPYWQQKNNKNTVFVDDENVKNVKKR